MASVNDETETNRLTKGSKFHKVELIPVGCQHGILRGIGRIVVAESAGNATDGKDEVIGPIAETKPWMVTGSALRQKATPLATESGASARVPIVRRAAQVVLSSVKLFQQPVRHCLEAVSGKLRFEREWWLRLHLCTF